MDIFLTILGLVLAIGGFSLNNASKKQNLRDEPFRKEFQRLCMVEYPSSSKKSNSSYKTISEEFSGLGSLTKYFEENNISDLKVVENLEFKVILTTTEVVILDNNIDFKFAQGEGGTPRKMSLTRLKLEEIENVLIGKQHHTNYQGTTSNQENSILVTINTKDSRSFTRSWDIGATEALQNQRRPFLTRKLQHISDWLPVVDTGETVESSSGYVTSVSFGFWNRI